MVHGLTELRAGKSLKRSGCVGFHSASRKLSQLPGGPCLLWICRPRRMQPIVSAAATEPAKASATEPAKASATEPAKASATEPVKAAAATEPAKASATPAKASTTSAAGAAATSSAEAAEDVSGATGPA